MSDSIDEGLPNLEVKLGKMIDKLIETDEDLEKNGLNSFFFMMSFANQNIKNYLKMKRIIQIFLILTIAI